MGENITRPHGHRWWPSVILRTADGTGWGYSGAAAADVFGVVIRRADSGPADGDIVQPLNPGIDL